MPVLEALLSDPTASAEDLRTVFRLNPAGAVCTLIANPATPDDVLLELASRGHIRAIVFRERVSTAVALAGLERLRNWRDQAFVMRRIIDADGAVSAVVLGRDPHVRVLSAIAANTTVPDGMRVDAAVRLCERARRLNRLDAAVALGLGQHVRGAAERLASVAPDNVLRVALDRAAHSPAPVVPPVGASARDVAAWMAHPDTAVEEVVQFCRRAGDTRAVWLAALRHSGDRTGVVARAALTFGPSSGRLESAVLLDKRLPVDMRRAAALRVLLRGPLDTAQEDAVEQVASDAAGRDLQAFQLLAFDPRCARERLERVAMARLDLPARVVEQAFRRADWLMRWTPRTFMWGSEQDAVAAARRRGRALYRWVLMCENADANMRRRTRRRLSDLDLDLDGEESALLTAAAAVRKSGALAATATVPLARGIDEALISAAVREAGISGREDRLRMLTELERGWKGSLGDLLGAVVDATT